MNCVNAEGPRGYNVRLEVVHVDGIVGVIPKSSDPRIVRDWRSQPTVKQSETEAE
jgi:hypothetical protein